MPHDLNLQLQKIFDLAMSLPAMYTFTMLKLSEDYRNIPTGIQNILILVKLHKNHVKLHEIRTALIG